MNTTTVGVTPPSFGKIDSSRTRTAEDKLTATASAAGHLNPPPMTTPRCRRLFFIRPYVLGACDAEAAVVGAEQAGEGLPPLGSYEASDAGRFSG